MARFSRFVPQFVRLRVRFIYQLIRGTLEKEMFLVENFVREKTCFIDIGSNYGIYSYFMSKRFDQVKSFEPLLEASQELASLKIPNVSIYNYALSARSGLFAIQIPIIEGLQVVQLSSLENRDGETTKRLVSCRTLDSFNFTNVGLIKIDVEGHELSVLYGAIKTIRESSPVLLVEIEQRHTSNSIKDTFRFIEGLGYRGLFLWENQFHPIHKFDTQMHQGQSLDPQSRDYINNFLFVPEESSNPCF